MLERVPHFIARIANLILFWICSKDGSDVVTAGLVGLAFALIKAHQNTELNVMGIKFLEQFVKKRYIFGSGILKNLKEFLFADQEAPQYAGEKNSTPKIPSPTIDNKIISRMFDPIECDEYADNIGVR